MPEQSKFENVDLFASLEAIMKQNTGFYQSDLDIDKEIIAKAAACFRGYMCFQCFGGQLEAVFNACFYSNGCAVCKCYDRAVTDKAGTTVSNCLKLLALIFVSRF